MQNTIQVALPVPFADSLTYLLPASVSISCLKIGTRVIVPFRNKKMVAIVVALNEANHSKGLKAMLAIIDDANEEAFLPEKTLNFMRHIHQYYLTPLGEVVFAGIPKWFKNTQNPPLPQEIWWQVTQYLADNELSAVLKSEKQQNIYKYIRDNGPLQSRKMSHIEKTSAALCQALWKKKLLIKSDFCLTQAATVNDPKFTLTEDQQQCLAALDSCNNFGCFLLDGITGSGKTEVYIRLVEKYIKAKKQALLLVPEIGLTPQLFHEFGKRIKGRVAVLHSGLTPAARARTWLNAKTGDIDVIVATRSGIFTPFANLAIIIVDEEHDLSFKQQDGFRYSARDLAVLRAKLEDIPVILGSATPSLETLNNAQMGKYHWLKLRQRTNKQALPSIQVQDVRQHKMQKGLSFIVLQQIAAEIKKGNQVLVFLNRRGWSIKVTCLDCAWVAECDECDTYLTYHKHLHKLRCHHCERLYSLPEFCPQCGSQKIEPMGVGTEKIHHGLRSYLPDTEIIRVDRDTVKTPNQWQKTVDKIKSGIPCVMVGTQMLAKGHDFPHLTLVVIVNVDNSFYSLDFRATEHLSQLMIQVSGRAGRKDKEGKVIIQSMNPQHNFFKLLLGKSYQDFATFEINQRKELGFPPGSYMAIIRARAKSEDKLNTFFDTILQNCQENPTLSILGPIPAPMYKKMGLLQMQLIFNGNNRQSLHHSLKNIMSQLRNNKICTSILWSLDLDPVNLN